MNTCQHKLCSERETGCEKNCNRYVPAPLHRDGFTLCDGFGHHGKMLDMYLDKNTQELILTDCERDSIRYDNMSEVLTALQNDNVKWEDEQV